MLTAVLLLPNAAFGESPPGCAVGVANISGVLEITPSAKTTLTTMGIDWKVLNTLAGATACDAEVENSQIEVNTNILTIPPTDPNCPYAVLNFPISFSDGQEVIIHPDVMGACSNLADLNVGFNQVVGEADGIQFSVGGAPIGAPWSVSVSTAKLIFEPCILVEKDGPIKVKLVSGEALVTYDVTVTNCASGSVTSPLDNCSIVDTIAGPVNQDLGVISPGFPVSFSYDATIFGDTTNTVTVTCDDQADGPISDSDTHFVDTYFTGIIVMKEAPPKLPADTLVDYEVWITNDGSSTITNCLITDSTFGPIDSTGCESIAPNEMCHVEYTGVACSEAIDNRAFVECIDQAFELVSGESEEVPAPRCAAFSVDIDKVCDIKVVQVPQNDADPIDCTITVTNDGPDTLTNCVVVDS
jgi:hypothetical protein